jgi:hypothetical protein
MKKLDIAGMKFGRLTAIRQAGKIGQTSAWLCACECGNEKTIRLSTLRSGQTKSCGCIVKTHGQSSGGKRSRAYMVWDSMRSRCTNPNHRAWPRYGGRGISVSDSWMTFENFLADMGDPALGITLDRIKNDLGYCKENCRWTDWKTQNRNKTGTRVVSAFGASETVAWWSEVTGLSHAVLTFRLNSGWGEESSVSTPLRGSIESKEQILKKISTAKLAGVGR